jgi:hypothetical protein
MEIIKVKPILALKKGSTGKPTLTDKIINKAIRMRTRSIYFHSEIILDNKWISSNNDTGVVIRELKDLNNDNWDYIELPERSMTIEQHTEMWDYINDQEGKDYDFYGVFFSQLIKIGGNDVNKWFCSELGSKILQMIGYPELMHVVPANIDPGDLEVICRKI